MSSDFREKIALALLERNFTVRALSKSCFDIICRKGSQILLLKVLKNANSISSGYADEMKKISSYLDASPLIISERSDIDLEDSVVYSRMGICTLNMMTFLKALDNHNPIIKKTRAGLVACINGDKLKSLREKNGFSLSYLSERLGVSKRMISRYEEGINEVTIGRSSRVYDLFGEGVFERINIFSFKSPDPGMFSSSLSIKYKDLGFEPAELFNSPFDIIAKKEGDIIFTEVDKVNKYAYPISQMIGASNLVICDKNKPKDIPSLTREEFMGFDRPAELLRFIKTF